MTKQPRAPRGRAQEPSVKQYGTTGSTSVDELHPNVSYAKAYALIAAGARVLDVGCGSGELASYLAARGDRVWGVDVNPVALALAAPHCVETRCADLENVEIVDLFPGLRFDAVVFADSLEHVREPWRVLQSARAVLEDNGYVVASIPNFAHAAVRLAVICGALPYRGLGILDDTHLRFFTFAGIDALFEESGFRLQAVERTVLPFGEPSDLVPDVRMLRVPPDVEDHARADAESETLQFVVRAIKLPGPWDMSTLRRRLHDVDARAQEQGVAIRNLERDVAAERERAATAARERDLERANAAEQLADADADLKRAQEAAVATAAAGVASTARLEAALDHRAAELERLQREHDETAARAAALHDQMARQARELGATESALAVMAERMSALDGALAAAEQRADDTTGERDLADMQVVALKSAVGGAEARASAALAKLADAERELAAAEDAARERREQMGRLQVDEARQRETLRVKADGLAAAVAAALDLAAELGASEAPGAAGSPAEVHRALELIRTRVENTDTALAEARAEVAVLREREQRELLGRLALEHEPPDTHEAGYEAWPRSPQPPATISNEKASNTSGSSP